MILKKPKGNSRFCSIPFIVLVFLSLIVLVVCQDLSDYDQFSNPAAAPLLTQLVYSKVNNLTAALNGDIAARASFCITNPNEDWDRAFNFSTDLTFLTSCFQKTQDDITKRFCTAAEVKLYFDNFFSDSGHGDSVKPNKNCNLTSWDSGCEPGWACSVGQTEQVDFQNSQHIPERTQNCQSCCEGFFCPRGLTCMIPCALGSYCPLATLNKDTGLCEPYGYQLPPGKTNHTCGGANLWADVRSASEIFCPAGSYCSTTSQRSNCSSGYYCRMGSTAESRCYKLTSCNLNTAYQDLHVYGAMLIAALSTLLLIIYNCSDQVLSTREKRQAKSREAAARSARETTKANQRWKAVKDAATKHANEWQNQLAGTFSSEHHKISGSANSNRDHDLYPTTASKFPEDTSKDEPSDSIKEMHEIVIDADNDFSFNPEAKNKKIKRKIPKGKPMHTRSERFRFAYAQIEKEKVQLQENQNLTFSGIVSMATNPGIRKRPLIEISFKELTLTLKSKKKHLLRCVTGDIKPGRITAVMGPSGAGKTTLLSALAGKTVGCKSDGLILVNGENVSIHSYKRIIGFVPQDDIVHGNLTVEENLWFSANCRLSTGLSKADKVLTVERVIESLGLQSTRNSLVGTVEKRGISGGQRKRVNVGLEMVMEPSLLFLDEPTSGLDSASSQLLLRALRRESLEGVNICMVVHQPSYALFTMFDDLILLAKGGLTVYHGPVNKVEEYFGDLGIIVPDRINPPDYYIDILEGMVNSNVSCTELPVRWMLHKGYPVPPDMQRNASGTDKHSFAGDFWQDIKSNMQLHRDKIRLNFLQSKDLSNRRTPGIFQQYRYYVGRVGKQRLREARTQAIDYLILLLAGACLGSLANVSDETFGMLGYTYTIIGVSLLCKIAALRSFTMDKLQYWRESSSGISSLAYFLSKDTIDHFNTVIKPVVYLSMFFFFTTPRSSFLDNYTVMLCLVYCVTGIAYAFAIFLEPGAAQLSSVLLPVVLTLIATRPKTNEALKIISSLCCPKWALEGFVIANAERYYGVWLITRCGTLHKNGYDLNHWRLCITILILYGLVGRVLAFIGMVTFKRR